MWCHLISALQLEPCARRCSQTTRRDVVVGRFIFPRASHKSGVSAVLFIELITVNSVQFYNFTQEQLYCSCAVMLTVNCRQPNLFTHSWLCNCCYWY